LPQKIQAIDVILPLWGYRIVSILYLIVEDDELSNLDLQFFQLDESQGGQTRHIAATFSITMEEEIFISITGISLHYWYK